jgi:hypothetical protein
MQQNALWYALGGPFLGGRAGHVDNGKAGINLPRGPGDLPAIDGTAQIDVRNKSAVGFAASQERTAASLVAVMAASKPASARASSTKSWIR